MEKVKVLWDAPAMSSIVNLCDTLATHIPHGCALERLVVLEWYNDNFSKILRGSEEFKFKLSASQAYSFHRLLLQVGVTNLLEDHIRNNIVAALDHHLQNQKLLSHG